jgi:hypothetical protein
LGILWHWKEKSGLKQNKSCLVFSEIKKLFWQKIKFYKYCLFAKSNLINYCLFERKTKNLIENFINLWEEFGFFCFLFFCVRTKTLIGFFFLFGFVKA